LDFLTNLSNYSLFSKESSICCSESTLTSEFGFFVFSSISFVRDFDCVYHDTLILAYIKENVS